MTENNQSELIEEVENLLDEKDELYKNLHEKEAVIDTLKRKNSFDRMLLFCSLFSAFFLTIASLSSLSIIYIGIPSGIVGYIFHFYLLSCTLVGFVSLFYLFYKPDKFVETFDVLNLVNTQ